jgi:transposase
VGVAANEVDTKKKTLKYKERDPEKRMAYLRALREIIARRGSKDIAYVDESGFEPDVGRRYGWSLRGEEVHGDHSGHRRPRTSLIAARRGKDFLAPMLFQGTANADLVNDWTRNMLCQELRPGSTIIWDNAPFHKKKELEAIAEEHGHHILFLPPYSPDFNPIEHDFANIKKRRQYAPPNTSLDTIVRDYGNYSE